MICTFQIDPGIYGTHGYMDPPEYCDNNAVAGTEYCESHQEDLDDYMPSFDYTAAELLRS